MRTIILGFSLLTMSVTGMLFVPVRCVAETVDQLTNAPTPRLDCAERGFDFGTVMNTGKVTHAFAVANIGDAPLRIERIYAGCGCTVAKAASDTVSPGSTTDVTIVFTLAGRSGQEHKSIYVHSNDPATPVLRLEMSGMVVLAPRSSIATVGDNKAPPDRPLAISPNALAGDLYTVPEELAFVISPLWTNSVSRILAIRSRTGSPFGIKDVRVPVEGVGAEVIPIGQANGYYVKLSGIIPSESLDGQIIAIAMDDGTLFNVRLTAQHLNASGL